MDIFFSDPNEIPLPPEEMRILEFKASPYNDGRRVRVYLEVTPFQKRPSVEVNLLDLQLRSIAEVSIIESMTRKMEFTMHLREPQPAGSYRVHATVYYEEMRAVPDQGAREAGPEAGPEAEAKPEYEPGPAMIVDEGEAMFELPPAEAE
jgi:hypothetical protein